MGYLSNEIQDIISKLKLSVTIVNKNRSFELKKKLAKKYSIDKQRPQILSWQNLENAESHHDSDGWKLLENFVGEEEVLLFLNPEDEQIMWKFNNGTDLELLLSESTGFPFCIISEKANYILCFEDHDCLVGVGEAVSWIKEQREKKAKS
jgi:hypothetical protein